MQFRAATAGDVPAVLPMVRSICALHAQWDPAKYGFTTDPVERYRDWLTARASDPRAVFLVADRSDESDPIASNESAARGPALVGFLIGAIEQEIPIYTLRQYGFIHDLWVGQTYRNEGIGRQLALLAIERFAALGVRQVRLAAAAANHPAQALFASCGFRVSAMEMLLEVSGGGGNT